MLAVLLICGRLKVHSVHFVDAQKDIHQPTKQVVVNHC